MPTPAYSATLAAAPTGGAANFDTLRRMRELVRAAKVDPRVMQSAHGIIYTQPERDELAEARVLYEYVRDWVRYVRDVHGVETLAYPYLTLQRGIGDCDDQVTLLCSLFEAAGYPTRFVMTGYDGGPFSHVYCQVFAAGQWIDCDPIERAAVFGWAPPDPTSIFIERV